MRIGGQLVQAGLVTAEQVEECLKAQVVEGARLGTNLVERGYIELDDLAEALGRQHELPAATSKHFKNADPELQAKLSPELAARWHTVPLGYLSRDPDRIAVVSSDPLPHAGLDALSYALGGEIVPAIAPELRVLYFLEQVYGIPRLNRFRRVQRAPTEESPPVDADDAEGRERRQYVKTVSKSAAVEPPNSLARIAIRKIAVQTAEIDGPITEVLSVDGAVRAMRRANDRDQLARILIDGLSLMAAKIEVGMILVFRKGMAIGWNGFVRGGDDHVVEGIALPLSEPSVFKTVMDFGVPCVGIPNAEELDCVLWEGLGVGAPMSWVVAPVTLRDNKTVAAVYVQSSRELGDDVIDPVLALAKALSMGFRKLVNAAER